MKKIRPNSYDGKGGYLPGVRIAKRSARFTENFSGNTRAHPPDPAIEKLREAKILKCQHCDNFESITLTCTLRRNPVECPEPVGKPGKDGIKEYAWARGTA